LVVELKGPFNVKEVSNWNINLKKTFMFEGNGMKEVKMERMRG
jgi:hypothetical protein